MTIDDQHQELLLEAIEDLMYKVSLELNQLKGQPMTAKRKRLTAKQKELEKLQHQVHIRK